MWSISGDVKPLKDPVLNSHMDVNSPRFHMGTDIESLHHAGHLIVVSGHLVWMVSKGIALGMLGL